MTQRGQSKTLGGSLPCPEGPRRSCPLSFPTSGPSRAHQPNRHTEIKNQCPAHGERRNPPELPRLSRASPLHIPPFPASPCNPSTNKSRQTTDDGWLERHPTGASKAWPSNGVGPRAGRALDLQPPLCDRSAIACPEIWSARRRRVAGATLWAPMSSIKYMRFARNGMTGIMLNIA